MTGQDAMLPRRFRVVERIRELEGVATLVVAPDDGGQAAPFRPGQFNMLYAFGVGEVPISISGDAGAPGGYRHTIRAVGQVTHALTRLQPGDQLGLRGPLGQGWPLERARGADLVLAAGGLGLAPLRPVVEKVLAGRGDHGRVVLYCGTRSPDTLLYAGELESWRKAGIEVQVTVDRAAPGWQGAVGVVTSLMKGGDFRADRATALICGPEVMMRFSAQTLAGLGIAEGRIFLSMERNMNCGVGLCGHCQFGPKLVCRDGPVFPLPEVEPLMRIREL